jgi:hypothetical protein
MIQVPFFSPEHPEGHMKQGTETFKNKGATADRFLGINAAGAAVVSMPIDRRLHDPVML